MAIPNAQTERILYGFAPGDIKQIESGVFRKTEKGFHTGSVKYLVYENGTTVKKSNTFLAGSAHPLAATDEDYEFLYVTESTWTECGGAIWEVDVSFKGFFGDLSSGSQLLLGGAYTRRVRVQAGNFKAKSLSTATGTGPHDMGDPILTVTYQYIQRSIKPDTSLINTAINPPDAPAVPPNQWVYLPDYVLRHPNGWVLDAREYDDILRLGDETTIENQIFFVTDTFAYYHWIRPGDF